MLAMSLLSLLLSLLDWTINFFNFNFYVFILPSLRLSTEITPRWHPSIHTFSHLLCTQRCCGYKRFWLLSWFYPGYGLLYPICLNCPLKLLHVLLESYGPRGISQISASQKASGKASLVDPLGPCMWLYLYLLYLAGTSQPLTKAPGPSASGRWYPRYRQCLMRKNIVRHSFYGLWETKYVNKYQTIQSVVSAHFSTNWKTFE